MIHATSTLKDVVGSFICASYYAGVP